MVYAAVKTLRAGEKIKLEKATLEASEQAVVTAALKKEISELEAEVDATQERDAQLEAQCMELENEKRDTLDRIDAANRAQKASLEPVFERLEEEVSLQKSEIHSLQQQKKEKEKQKTAYF